MIGFVAATFMRGVPIIQIPTTLLAMVDSSIGGKVAVDVPAGKNLVGAFHQPRRIYADMEYLQTLPIREVVNGMAEVVKTCAFWSEEDFGLCEEGVDRVLEFARGNRDPISRDLITRLVVSSARVKSYVVTNDEKEGGLRNVLNFGHSIGHAIEAILAPDLLHGECVSIGMILECEVGRALGICDQGTVERLARCCAAYGLPTKMNDPLVVRLTGGRSLRVTAEQILEVMRVDKKNRAGRKRLVMIRSIGTLHEQDATAVDDRIIRKVLAPAVQLVSPPRTARP
ncbi:3-dehydroquinate dehydratase (3-dehydroquinase), partial [Gonapodya sp. JEL0774]